MEYDHEPSLFAVALPRGWKVTPPSVDCSIWTYTIGDVDVGAGKLNATLELLTVTASVPIWILLVVTSRV